MLVGTAQQYRDTPLCHGLGDESKVNRGKWGPADGLISDFRLTISEFRSEIRNLESEILNQPLRSERQADCSPRAALQSPVNCTCVADKVGPGLRIPREELVRQHVTLQSIARRAGADEVSRRVGATARHRMDVVERRFHRIEAVPAIHAAAAAIAHGRALELSLVVPSVPGRSR